MVKTGLKRSLLPSPIGVNQFGVLPSPIRDTRHCQLNDRQRVERSLVVIYAEWEVIRAIFGCVLSICVNYYNGTIAGPSMAKKIFFLQQTNKQEGGLSLLLFNCALEFKMRE